jgi:hypothetical protein
MIYFLGVEEVRDCGADVVGTKVTPLMIGKDTRQEANHECPSRVWRIGDLQTISHQEEVSDAELMEIESGAGVWTISIREAAGSSKVSSGGSGV